MGNYTITIDTGTTNTRVFLWDETRSMVSSSKSETGVRNTAVDGNNECLKRAVHDCIEEVLSAADVTLESVNQVIACGMITSNVGLVEIPHVPAPVGVLELAAKARRVLMEDVCPLPILFVPGVKNNGSLVTVDNFEAMDMMRGEEVETLAILDRFPKGREYLLVLPGSHTKFVSVDSGGRMTGCLTTIGGELLSCITNDTIIADALNRSFVQEGDYDRKMMLKGFDEAMRVGLGRACFSARILSQFAEKNKKQLANFILGAALAGDVQAVKASSALSLSIGVTVVVSGKNPLRQAIVDMLKHDSYFTRIEEFAPEPSLPLSAAGAFLVADRYYD